MKIPFLPIPVPLAPPIDGDEVLATEEQRQQSATHRFGLYLVGVGNEGRFSRMTRVSRGEGVSLCQVILQLPHTLQQGQLPVRKFSLSSFWSIPRGLYVPWRCL